MRKQVTQVTIVCDGCKKKIPDSLPSEVGKVHELDLCAACLQLAYIEFQRVVNREVPTRRGGYRKLGEYDG